jgi:ATP-dependent DNA helicase RecG
VTLTKTTDFSTKKQTTNLNQRQIKAVQYVKENHKITNKEYQIINNISRETASRDLKILVDVEIFINSGVKGAGAVYFLK